MMMTRHYNAITLFSSSPHRHNTTPVSLPMIGILPPAPDKSMSPAPPPPPAAAAVLFLAGLAVAAVFVAGAAGRENQHAQNQSHKHTKCCLKRLN